MGIRDRISSAARQLLAAGTPEQPSTEQATDAFNDPNALAQSSRGFLGDLWFSTQAMYNAVTGVGTQRDASFFNAWAVPRPLRRAELFGLGRNGLSYQALSKLPSTATREGWRVTITDPAVEDAGEKSDKIAAYEERLGLPMHMARAMTRGRQYGEAMVVLGIDDGRAMSEPVDVTRIRSIKWAAVIDVRYYEPAELYQADNEHFTDVRLFRITDINGFLEDGLRYGPNSLSFTSTTLPWEGHATSGEMYVHRDRVMHFPTVDWLPLLDTIQDSLGAFMEAMSGIRTGARESTTVVYKISEWLKKQWSENATLAQQHMSFVDRAKSALNAWVIDKEKEDVQITSRSLSGLADLGNPFMVWLSAALATPVTVLWGVSPGGFGKGEAERETWHEEVRAYFAWAAKPEIYRVSGYILAADDGCRLPYTTQRTIEINDLSPPDEETRSKLRNEAVDDLTTAFEKGGLTRDEYRAALAQLNDDYFRIELTEEGKRVTKDALVGAITGTVEILKAAGLGEIPPESAQIALARLIPSSFDIEAAAEIMAPIKARASASPASTATGGAAPVVGEDTAQTPESEVGLAWSKNPLPPDAEEASVIANELRIPTVRVTRAHRAGLIEGWNVLGGKPRYSREEVQRVILQGNGKLPKATDVRDTAEPEYSVAIMLRAPDDVARWVPYKAEDPSAPHVTVLYIGKVNPAQVVPIVDAVRRVAAETPALVIDIDGVGYFDNGDERVAYAHVVQTNALQALHDALRRAIADAVAEPKHYAGGFTPHLTLAYLAPNEDYTGPIPPHGWAPREIEVWIDDVAISIPCADLPGRLRDVAIDTADGFFERGSDPKVYTKPDLRNRLRSKILREGRGGDPGEWSARKAQLLALEYKRAGGGYRDGCEAYEVEDYLAAVDYVDTLDKSEAQRSLKKWTREEWMTCLPSGPSKEPAGSRRRYLPRRACEQLSKREREATNRKKSEGARKGKQFVANTEAAKEARNRTTDGVADFGVFDSLLASQMHDAIDSFDEAAWLAECEDLSDDKKRERIDEAFAKYHATVNMGAAELERWAETEWSRKASLSRAPIERNLRLLRKRKEDWTLADASAAMRTVNFVSRMKGAEQGKPVKIGEREGPSKRDISLKNWAFDPRK